jgi:hypothetical protein
VELEALEQQILSILRQLVHLVLFTQAEALEVRLLVELQADIAVVLQLVELVAMKPQFYALLLVAVVAIGLALVAHTKLVVAVAVALILETMVQPMVRMVAKANMAASVEIMAVAVAALVGITFLAVAVEAVLLTQTTYMSLMGQQLLL